MSEYLRAIENAAAASEDVLGRLSQHKPDALFAELGRRVRGYGDSGDGGDLERGGVRSEIGFDISLDTDDGLRGPDGEATTFGQRIFWRWSKVLHEYVCDPGAEEQEQRNRLKGAILKKGASGTAILAAALVSNYGLSAGVSALVAALLVQLLVVPAKEEICETWGNALAKKPE